MDLSGGGVKMCPLCRQRDVSPNPYYISVLIRILCGSTVIGFLTEIGLCIELKCIAYISKEIYESVVCIYDRPLVTPSVLSRLLCPTSFC